MHSHHSHSGQYCTHAAGTLESCVEEALARGMVQFSMTEHIPRWRETDLYPGEEDVGLEGLFQLYDGFYTHARALQRRYRVSHPQFQLLVGLETEYLRAIDLRILELLAAKYPPDLIVGSVHHVRGIPIDFDAAMWQDALRACDGDIALFYNTYLDHQLEVITRLQPAVIGHFDVILLYAPDEYRDWLSYSGVRERARRNIDAVVAYGGLFELNGAALRKGWPTPYPRPDVVQMIQAAGGRFCLSDDSHGPAQVALNYDRVQQYVRDMGIDTLYRVTRQSTPASDVLDASSGPSACTVVASPAAEFLAWSARSST